MYQPRKCKECGKMFTPKSARQFYCKDIHYRTCPVCGKVYEAKYLGDPIRACSAKCTKARATATNLERYGVADAGNRPESLEKRRKTNLEKYGYADAGNRPEAKEKRKQTNLERYGVENAGSSDVAKKHRAQTNLERYGVENAMESAEIQKRSKDGMLAKYGVSNARLMADYEEKVKKTNKEKYGCEWCIASKEVRRKAEATMLERYNTLFPTQLAKVQERTKATCLKRYGVPSYFMTQQFKDAYKQTMLDRYGVSNPRSIPGVREKIEATNIERYGVPYAFLSEESLRKNQAAMRCRISKLNQSFSDLLTAADISHNLEFLLDRKWFDIEIPDQKILIEIDPTYTHSREPSFYYPNGNDDKYYHRNKSKVAESHGYRCIHVFDWDDTSDIIDLLRPKTNVIYARNCQVDFIPTETAEEFMDMYHIQHSVRGQVICVGLIYGDEIVSVMTFGKPRYTNKYQFELLRYATVTDVRVIGGASKLYHFFISEITPQSVLSYCNRSKFTGKVYSEIGMKLLRKNPPSLVWSKDKEVVTSALLKQRGYDQLFGTNYGKGTSNEQLMQENGWRSVYDCGQDVYVWGGADE